MSQEWRTVTVVGVGLIGGSFALALRKAGFQGRIIGVSSPQTVEAALQRGVIDEALPLAEAVAQSDLIYLAQSIEKILETLDVIDEMARPGALITDAGSTKRDIVARAAQKIQRARFVGGHPMAGKEARGVAAADEDLFQGRPWVLTSSDPELEGWIEKIGARLVHLDAAEHDRLVAVVSHVPQLLSTALASMIAECPDAANVAGPAARDLTRLALSPYDIWRDIFATNAAEIDRVLGIYITHLQKLRIELGRGPVVLPGKELRMEKEFERAARGARAVRPANS